MQQMQQSNLIVLTHSKQQNQLEAIKSQLSQYAKYFFAARCNSTIVYDKNIIYILEKDSTKIIDLGKNYLINQLTYSHDKQALAFVVVEGILYFHFIQSKTTLILKKDCKRQILINFLFSIPTYANLLVAEQNSIKLLKIEDDKKSLKEAKSISGKFSCFLYEPYTETLLVFPFGDCKQVLSFIFVENKLKSNNFKGPTITIDFSNDDNIVKMVQNKKTLGIEGSKATKEVFYRTSNDQHLINVLKMNHKAYLLFYFANEGKLKLYPVTQQPQNELVIKLPSDSLPSFNVVDNMLVVHLKNQKITFLYDIKGSQVQMLVSPFPINHTSIKNYNLYSGQFIGKRIILPNGFISKWKINISVIHHYLKNQQLVFDFFIRRKKAKINMLKWLKQNLVSFKHINLSKFWKLIFGKLVTNSFQERDVVTLLDLYANVFYPLSNEQLIDKQILVNIVVQCVRQALQYQLKIPNELQNLLSTLLLTCEKYQQLVFLIHNDVIKDSENLAFDLLQIGQYKKQILLEAMALDMGSRVCNAEQMLKLIGKTQQIREMKRFIKSNFEKMSILHPIYCAKYISCKKLQNEYLKFVRMFILQKIPSTNPIYLDEAEQSIRNYTGQIPV